MDVTLPNGNVIKDVPETATREEIRDKAIRGGLATAADFGDFRAEAAKRGVTSTLGAAAGVSQMISDYLTRLNLNP